jgi:hypothetical protein
MFKNLSKLVPAGPMHNALKKKGPGASAQPISKTVVQDLVLTSPWVGDDQSTDNDHDGRNAHVLLPGHDGVALPCGYVRHVCG